MTTVTTTTMTTRERREHVAELLDAIERASAAACSASARLAADPGRAELHVAEVAGHALALADAAFDLRDLIRSATNERTTR